MPTVFSAQGNGHTSDGNPDLMHYQKTNVNLPANSWNGSTFTVPTAGVYFFCITFVKDAFYEGGTQEDVYVTLRRNNQDIGRAWSGQGAGQRGTGAFNAALQLNAGDSVQTWADSDGGYKRHIAEYQFSGFLIS